MFERASIFGGWGNPMSDEESFTADYQNGCHIDIRARQLAPPVEGEG
jgi:hypothetical protein